MRSGRPGMIYKTPKVATAAYPAGHGTCNARIDNAAVLGRVPPRKSPLDLCSTLFILLPKILVV